VVTNSIYLLLSSLTAILVVILANRFYLFLTLALGLLFIHSQFLELGLFNSLFSTCQISLPLILINIHGSHIVLGSIFILVLLLINPLSGTHDYALELAILYWHLIEIVWLTLLFYIFAT
jgi:cytochrome c oxidase subunit 3